MNTLQATSRKPVVHRDLTPCDPREINRLIGPLFRNLESFRKFTDGPEGSPDWHRGQEEKKEAMAVYVRPLLNEPSWAIEQAVQRFLDGLVDRHRSRIGRVPMSDEFAIEVRRISEWAREQEAKEAARRRQLADIAEAKREMSEPKTPMGPEARAAVNAFLKRQQEIQEEAKH